MANEKHIEIVKQGFVAILTYRTENPGTLLDLGYADLSGADLRGADLRGADLSGANLSGANLSDANLSDAYLTGANLRGANLSDANLNHAILRRADLIGADLSCANLSCAKLSDARVNMARFGWTLFLYTRLEGVVGLNETRHFGPSSLDAETLKQSPPEFVRDCGYPETFVTYLPSLFTDPLGFYSCFISYNTADEGFCTRLHKRLRRAGISLWYAPKDVRAGHKLHEQIDEQIGVCDKLLVVLSEHSMGSEWVRTEIQRAWQRQKEDGRRRLFPIRLISFEKLSELSFFHGGRNLGDELREYYIPDFSDWQDDDAFEERAQKLIEDLERSEGQSRD